MRFRMWTRLGGALLGALWSAAIVSRPTLLACPMGMSHAAGPAGATSASMPAHSPHGSHAQHAQNAQHAAQVHASSASPLDAPSAPLPTHQQHPCDCLGHCCATAVALPSVYAATLGATVTTPDRADPPVPAPFVGGWIDHLIPFGTAPPANVVG